MANQLEAQAQRLKRKYGVHYYNLIEQNLRSVSEQMRAAPSGVAVQEGLIALSQGLPPRPRPLTLTRKARGKARGKELPKR
jgi:hypothetical protein